MNAIAEKIQLIEKLSGSPSEANRLLDKLIDFLLTDDQKKLARFRSQLADFEKQYGMTTAEFQRRFDSGELGDAPQWFDWDGFAALAASMENKLSTLGLVRG
jgi:hypothetical protein